MTEKLKALISNLKHKPGVYLMHNKDDTIIYVGKAKDLQKRVSQYFLRPQAGKVFKMVTEVDYFDTIITNNEKEAFVLEMNLIHEHYPKFNILLKDGAHYPYIALTKKNDPYLVIKRNDKDKNYDYFGPFPNSTAAHQMISLLNKIYPIRKCSNLQSSTCLYYHLGQCLAPCVNKVDENISNKIREDIKSFMRGNNQEVRKDILSKMQQASENLEFESALEYKKIIDSIDHINQSQNVENKDHKNRDIFAFTSRENYLSLAVLLYRHGLLLDKKTFIVEQFGDLEEQVSELILQFYENHPLPREIIINSNNVIECLSDLLDVEFAQVSKGNLYDLVLATKQNANNALDEYFLSARLDENKLEMLEELGNLLKIKTPLHIELFDNSHLQGSSPVGAMVAFINGEPAKSLYRKFKIEHEEKRNDLMSMKEVIYRRYTRLVSEERKLPDLILVDGGINQVKAAISTLNEIPVSIPVFGLFKNDKHQTSGLIDENEITYPLENKNIFFLLTRMQDEVHRFAISYHKEKRKAAMSVSMLDGIKGLGGKRKEILYKAYPDINSMKNASLEELSQLLPHEVAILIYQRLHNE